MDAYRVIRHSGDEDEGARWACRARQQRGDSRNCIGAYTRGPASLADLAVRVDQARNLLIPPLVRVASRPVKRTCARGWESRANGRRKSRTRL